MGMRAAVHERPTYTGPEAPPPTSSQILATTVEKHRRMSLSTSTPFLSSAGEGTRPNSLVDLEQTMAR
jgi:hypothetical protein